MPKYNASSFLSDERYDILQQDKKQPLTALVQLPFSFCHNMKYNTWACEDLNALLMQKTADSSVYSVSQSKYTYWLTEACYVFWAMGNHWDVKPCALCSLILRYRNWNRHLKREILNSRCSATAFSPNWGGTCLLKFEWTKIIQTCNK